MKLLRLALLPLVLAAMATLAQAQVPLTELNGKYVFGGHGDRYGLLGLIDQPVADVGFVVFDGKGVVTTAKIFEDVNNALTSLQESGTYVANADGSFTVTLTGTQSRTFNVFADDVSSTTGIAEKASGDDVGAGDGAGDDLAVNFEQSLDPSAGWSQADAAGTFAGSFAGTDAYGEKASGVEEIVVDTNGNITGKGHEALNGNNEADTIAGQITVAPDGTYMGTVTVNGNSYPTEGVLIGAAPAPTNALAKTALAIPTVPVIDERMFMVSEDQGTLRKVNPPLVF